MRPKIVGHLVGEEGNGASLRSGDAVLEELASGVDGGSGFELPLWEDTMASSSRGVGRVFRRKPSCVRVGRTRGRVHYIGLIGARCHQLVCHPKSAKNARNAYP